MAERTKALLGRPTVLAAVIAAGASIGVALAGVVIGSISAYYQRQSDSDKLRTTLIINISSQGEAGRRADVARALIESGVLPDQDGSICMAFVGKGCPLKVLKPN